MQITRNFSLVEFRRSWRAEKLGLDNTPPPEAEACIVALCEKILQPVRDHFGLAVFVDSGYRCAALNDAVGGAKNSQHLRGEAADIRVNAVPAREVAEWIGNSSLPFDQVIFERKLDGTEWVHVSHSPLPRRQALQAAFDHNGKPVYAPLFMAEAEAAA